MYPRDRIELPGLSGPNCSRTPAGAYRSPLKEQDAMTDDQRREAIQAYHASTTFMDAQAGQVLDALDRLGLSDSTIVVFTSDHGLRLIADPRDARTDGRLAKAPWVRRR